MTTHATPNAPDHAQGKVLFVALKPSENTWKAAFTTGHGQQPRERTLAPRDPQCLLEAVARAKAWGFLPETTPVVSCYEAGRDGFWLHRFLQAQGIVNVETERCGALQTSSDASLEKVRRLMLLKGSGINGTWLLVMAFCGWRVLKNRREVGGLAGRTPRPYRSGNHAREQGMSTSGNRHGRWMIVELAWSWLHSQPESALRV